MPAIPVAFDNQRYTVMSYNDAGTTAAFLGTANAISFRSGFANAITPMVLDIAAVQAIYGADPTTRTGDNVYRFDQSATVVQSIYDAGGL